MFFCGSMKFGVSGVPSFFDKHRFVFFLRGSKSSRKKKFSYKWKELMDTHSIFIRYAFNIHWILIRFRYSVDIGSKKRKKSRMTRMDTVWSHMCGQSLLAKDILKSGFESLRFCAKKDEFVVCHRHSRPMLGKPPSEKKLPGFDRQIPDESCFNHASMSCCSFSLKSCYLW